MYSHSLAQRCRQVNSVPLSVSTCFFTETFSSLADCKIVCLAFQVCYSNLILQFQAVTLITLNLMILECSHIRSLPGSLRECFSVISGKTQFCSCISLHVSVGDVHSEDKLALNVKQHSSIQFAEQNTGK